MTQPGETSEYSVADHIEAILSHAQVEKSEANRFIQTVVVNDEVPNIDDQSVCKSVRVDEDRVNALGITVVGKPLLNKEPVSDQNYQHDSNKLAQFIMLEAYKDKKPRSLTNIDYLASETETAVSLKS
jgi:2-phospho-L-lactate transferase/gluconeogenesis factor (CofD/UPF0052 family)